MEKLWYTLIYAHFHESQLVKSIPQLCSAASLIFRQYFCDGKDRESVSHYFQENNISGWRERIIEGHAGVVLSN